METWDVTVSGGTVTKVTLLNTAYYGYDTSDRLVSIREESGHGVSRSFDSKENVTGFTESFGTKQFQYTYTYDRDDRPTGTGYGDTETSTGYDSFSRMSGTGVSYNSTDLIETGYTYRTVTEGDTVYETTQVAGYAVTVGNSTTTHSFSYDDNGNILSVSDGTYTTGYEYDTLGQLTKETNQSTGA